jgi:hypothetical protein
MKKKATNNKNNSNIIMKRWNALNWLTPYKLFAHGISGIISTLVGFYCVIQAVLGVATDIPSYLFYTYFISTLTNAISGLKLNSKHKSLIKTAFFICSILQIGYIYFAWRFYQPNPDFFSFYYLSILDKVMIICILLSILGLIVSIIVDREEISSHTGIIVAIILGCLGLATFTGYPLQLSFSTSEYATNWYSCLLDEFPLQNIAFVFYVYIPATVAFGVMIFSVTLMNREIITKSFFVTFILTSLVFMIVLTVLMQENHIPVVTTQKFIILCPARKNVVFDNVNVSIAARFVLSLFGKTFSKPL